MKTKKKTDKLSKNRKSLPKLKKIQSTSYSIKNDNYIIIDIKINQK